MDIILVDVIPVQVANTFNRYSVTIQLNFLTLHDFLDSGAYVAYANINARRL